MVDIRFPVADADSGRLWTLRLERIQGRPGLWPHPEELTAARAEPAFYAALQTAWRWACAADQQVRQCCVRWQIVQEGREARATGGSVGAAAAVGLAYLLALAEGRRRIDPHSAVSATVTEEGKLGRVSELATKLGRSGRDWQRLVVCTEDEQTALDAVRGDLPEVVAAGDVLAAAKLVARRPTPRTAIAATALAVMALGLVSWYLFSAATAASHVSLVRARDAQALRLASLAGKLAVNHPPIALRLAVAAYRLDPASVDARAALIQLTQEDPRIMSFLGSDGGPPITRLAASSAGTVVVSASADGTVRSWHAACGTCRPSLLSRGTAVRAVAVSTDGGLVATARGNGIRLTTPAGGPATGWPAMTLHLGAAVDAVAINADDNQIAAGTADGGVYVWTRGRAGPQSGAIHGAGVISALAFLPDGRLVTGTADPADRLQQDLSVWRTTGHLVRTVLATPKPPLTVLAATGVRSLAVVGNDLVVGETYLELRPLNSLNSMRTIHLSAPVVALVPLNPTHVLVGTTNSLVVSANPLVSAASETPPSSFLDMDIATGHQQEVSFSSSLTCLTPAAATGPRHTLLTGTTSGLLVRWSPAPQSSSQVLRVVPDPLNRSGVILSRADGSVAAFNAASGQLATLIATHRHGAASALAATGSTVFAGYNDGTVLQLRRRTTAGPVAFLHLPEKVFSLSIDPSERLLAIGGSRGLVQLFRLPSGKLLRTLPGRHAGGVYNIAFDPAGRLVASSSVQDGVDVQRVDGTATQSTALLSVGLLAWLPNGELLAGDGTGNLYRLQLPLPAAPSPIAHPDGANILGGELGPARRVLVIASADQSAVLFDISADRVLGRFSTLDASRSGSFAAATWAAAFTPDGRYAVFGTEEGHLQILTADTASLTARACAMAPSAPTSVGAVSPAELHSARLACS